MKQQLILFVLLLLLPLLGSAQSGKMIEGEVLDSLSGEALPYVNIYFKETRTGTTTNSKGQFSLQLPDGSLPKELIISYIGYKTETVPLATHHSAPLKILLQAEALLLNSVIVTPRQALDIVYQAIESVPQNYNLASHAVEGFQRELVRSEDHYIQVLEASFRTVQDHNGLYSQLLGGRYAEDKMARGEDGLWTDKRGGFYTFGLTGLGGIMTPAQNSFLGIAFKKNKDFSHYYDFDLQGTIHHEGKDLYVIDFDQKDKVRKALIKGTLFIDTDSKAFVKMSYGLSPKGLKYLKTNQRWNGDQVSSQPFMKKIKFKNEQYHYTYVQSGSKWYLNTFIMDAEFDASIKILVNLAKNKSLKYHSERIISAIDTVSNKTKTEGVAPGDFYYFQVFLKNKYENYNPEDWSNYTTIKSDTSFTAIIRQLNLNNQAWAREKD